MRLWYCAQTAPKQELVAKQQLERQGITTFLPSFLVKDKSRHIIVKCLFNSYLFVSLDNPADWPLVKNSHGITGMITHPSGKSEYRMPIPMSESVEILRLQALSYDEIRRDGGQREIVSSPRQLITVGCHVKILSGIWTDFNIQRPIVDWSENERATLVLGMFGRDMRIEFFHKDLEVIK